MRIILEKDEIVEILGRHFDSEFDPANVIIRTDPVFEIELRDIPMTPVEAKPTQAVAVPPPAQSSPTEDADLAAFRQRAHGANASTRPPPPGLDDGRGEEDSDDPAYFVRQSQAFLAQTAATHPVSEDDE